MAKKLKELFFTKEELNKINESIFEEEDSVKITEDERNTIMDSIKKYNELGKLIYREGNLVDVAKTLGKIAEFAEKYTIEAAGDWFDTVTIKKNMNQLKNSVKEFYKVAKEAQGIQDRLSSLYEDMGYILNRYYEIDDPIQEEVPVVSDREQNFSNKKIKPGDRAEVDMNKVRNYNPTPKYLRNVRDEIKKGAGTVHVHEIKKNGLAIISGREIALNEIEIPVNALKISSNVVNESVKYNEKKMKSFIKTDKFLQAQAKTTSLENVFNKYIKGDTEMEHKYEKTRV